MKKAIISLLTCATMLMTGVSSFADSNQSESRDLQMGFGLEPMTERSFDIQ